MAHNQMRSDRGPAAVWSRVTEFPGLATKFAPVDRMRDLYCRVQQSPEGFRVQNLLSEMRVELRVAPADEAQIPATGPAVVVANHPYGMLDGALLIALLTRVRPDVKVLANFLLSDVPELQQHCIIVDPFHTDRSGDANRKAWHQALDWLQRGGMLALFPAGEVSHWQMPVVQIVDPEWNDTAVRLIRHSGAQALPVFLCGHNSVGFQLLGMVHPRLRTAFLLQEFLQHEGKRVEVRVASPITTDTIAAMQDNRKAIEYLRWRTYLLARRNKAQPSRLETVRSQIAQRAQKPVAPAVSPALLADEIAKLPEERRLAENGDLAVYLGSASEMPQMLREVGRLRESTFRRAGEGTGESVDLDRFDRHYWHLMLWNGASRELVGAYRAGNTAEILPKHGIGGLYTSTLFRFNERIFHKLGPALELGRSFVRPEYQRQYVPLLLLWKGIARLVAMWPNIPVLFGAVSISNDYNKASRELIYRFFEARMQQNELAGLVIPRRPFRPGLLRHR